MRKRLHIPRSAVASTMVATLLIFLFVYTASSKLMGIENFRYTLGRSPLIGPLARVMAVFIPVIELLTAGLLLVPGLRRWGLLVSLGLLVVFTMYISYMILFTPHLPCSCGGVIRQLNWRQHLLFNTGCIALAGFGLGATPRKRA